MAHVISIKDLNTEVNDEPCVAHKKLAVALEYDQPHKLKHLIERNKQELLGYGEVSSTLDETTKSGGRPSSTYYLNEAQALLVCMFSKTSKAAEVRKNVIEVFMAYRRGELVEATISPAQQREIQEAVKRKAAETGKSYAELYGRFNNKFKLGSYKQLPVSRFDEAMAYLGGNMQPMITHAKAAPYIPDAHAALMAEYLNEATLHLGHVRKVVKAIEDDFWRELLEHEVGLMNRGLSNSCSLFCAMTPASKALPH